MIVIELQNKISHAEQVIWTVLEHYERPVVFSSFGKDSMVLLEIVKRMGKKLPIVFHREPFFYRKLEFANKVMADNEYEVYDFPPDSTAVVKANGHFEVLSYFKVGVDSTYVPTGIVEPKEGSPFLCGLKDLYEKPCGTFDFRWDCGFLGHKSSDVDPILGAIPLTLDIKQNPGSCDFAYPLRHFTDDDVWAYHKQFDVPINSKRYDMEKDGLEFENVAYNNDYYPTCMACMDPERPVSVHCPKLGLEVANVSKQLRWSTPARPDYLGGA